MLMHAFARLLAGASLVAVCWSAALVPFTVRALTAVDGQAAQLEPPDGTWLVDDQGRKYFLQLFPRRQGVRLDDGRVRTVWGITIDVVKEDEQWFYYKVYKVEPVASSLPPPISKAEQERIEATYRVDVKSSSHLRFEPFGNGLPSSGQWRDSFAVADINHDGHADIIHAPARKSLRPPVVFLGDGRGGWRRWQEASFPRLAYDYGAASVADFNGDGALDIVLAVHLRGLIALAGDGKGTFTAAGSGLDFSAKGHSFSSRAIAVADWNLDKRLDILAFGEGPRLALAPSDAGALPASTGVVIYLNSGDGAWTRQTAPELAGLFGSSIAAGDVNGDGRPDFVTGSSVMGRTDLLSVNRADGSVERVKMAAVRPAAAIREVTVADFNHDGLGDIALAYTSFEGEAWRSGIDVLYASAKGEWTRRVLAAEPGQGGPVTLDHGDLDADGQLDLVALTDEGHTWVFRGDGHGFFTREDDVIPPFDSGCQGSAVRIADLDNDGAGDLVTAFAQEMSEHAPTPCPGEGGITAWRTRRRAPNASPAARH